MHPHANFPSKPNSSHHPSFTTIAAAPSSPPPLFQSPPIKLNHVSVVRSQGRNHRKNNHIETRYVASAIYHRSLAVVSHRAVTFSVNYEDKNLSSSKWEARQVTLDHIDPMCSLFLPLVYTLDCML
jgi:hypothetical protein